MLLLLFHRIQLMLNSLKFISENSDYHEKCHGSSSNSWWSIDIHYTSCIAGILLFPVWICDSIICGDLLHNLISPSHCLAPDQDSSHSLMSPSHARLWTVWHLIQTVVIEDCQYLSSLLNCSKSKCYHLPWTRFQLDKTLPPDFGIGDALDYFEPRWAAFV